MKMKITMNMKIMIKIKKNMKIKDTYNLFSIHKKNSTQDAEAECQDKYEITHCITINALVIS